VLILKGVKVICFDPLLQVLILKGVTKGGKGICHRATEAQSVVKSEQECDCEKRFAVKDKRVRKALKVLGLGRRRCEKECGSS
jgi:hypothetical protein